MCFQLEWRYILWCLLWFVMVIGLFVFESDFIKWVWFGNVIVLGCQGNMLFLFCVGEEEGFKINFVFWGRDDFKICLFDKFFKLVMFCFFVGNILKFLCYVCEKCLFCIFLVFEMFFEKLLCFGVLKFLKVGYDCRVMSGMGVR